MRSSLRANGAKFFSLALAAGLSIGAAQAKPSDDADARLHAAWSTAIAHTPVPAGGGCFTASYPLTVWTPATCVTAPARPYIPAGRSVGGWKGTTGDGHDYAAQSKKITQTAVGSFPVVKGVKTESGNGRANAYSLQVNSDFMTSKACAGSSNPANCRGWEQFVYSSTSGAAFMQYWLIHYAAKCPSGWNTYSDDCYKNSAAIGVPLEPIDQLKYLKLSGNAVKNGIDTLVFTTKDKAYSTTGPDSVVYLAETWKQSEFNIVGDGGGSAAVFNAGSSLTVEIDITDGTKKAPKCLSDAGTTGETNNLNLGLCIAVKGKQPLVQFVESN